MSPTVSIVPSDESKRSAKASSKKKPVQKSFQQELIESNVSYQGSLEDAKSEELKL